MSPSHEKFTLASDSEDERTPTAKTFSSTTILQPSSIPIPTPTTSTTYLQEDLPNSIELLPPSSKPKPPFPGTLATPLPQAPPPRKTPFPSNPFSSTPTRRADFKHTATATATAGLRTPFPEAFQNVDLTSKVDLTLNGRGGKSVRERGGELAGRELPPRLNGRGICGYHIGLVVPAGVCGVVVVALLAVLEVFLRRLLLERRG